MAAGAAGHVIFFFIAGFDPAAVFAATLAAAFTAALGSALRAAGRSLAGVGAAGLGRHCGEDEDVVEVEVLDYNLIQYIVWELI